MHPYESLALQTFVKQLISMSADFRRCQLIKLKCQRLTWLIGWLINWSTTNLYCTVLCRGVCYFVYSIYILDDWLNDRNIPVQFDSSTNYCLWSDQHLSQTKTEHSHFRRHHTPINWSWLFTHWIVPAGSYAILIPSLSVIYSRFQVQDGPEMIVVPAIVSQCVHKIGI